MNGYWRLVLDIAVIALAAVWIIMALLAAAREMRDLVRYRKFRKSLAVGKIITMRKPKQDPWDNDKLIAVQIDDLRGDYMRYHDIEDKISSIPYQKAEKIKYFWRKNHRNIL